MAKNVDSCVNNLCANINLACKLGIQNSKRYIKKKVTQVEQESLQTVVYNSYEPKYYKRRKGNDGLYSTKNIVILDQGTSVSRNISSTSNTQDGITLNDFKIKYSFDCFNITNFNYNTKYIYKFGFLSDLVENGYNLKDKPYNKPRPFMKTAEDRLKKSVLQYIVVENIETSLKGILPKIT